MTLGHVGFGGQVYFKRHPRSLCSLTSLYFACELFSIPPVKRGMRADWLSYKRTSHQTAAW